MDKILVKSARRIVFGFALIISLFLVVISLIYMIDVSNMNVKQDNIFLGLAGIVAVYSAAGWWWIMNSQSMPSSDQKSIYEIAVFLFGLSSQGLF